MHVSARQVTCDAEWSGPDRVALAAAKVLLVALEVGQTLADVPIELPLWY